jgi:hypothetical protein
MLRRWQLLVDGVRTGVRKNGSSGYFRVAAVNHVILPIASHFLSVAAYNSLETFLSLGYWPSLRNPRTFNEKLLWRKLHDNNPLYPVVTDKYRVRDYVAARVGTQVLTKLLHVTGDPTTIPFGALPRSFVIKANFGAGRNIFVRDKSMADRAGIVSQCQAWLAEKCNSRFDEWKLHDMPRLIVVEEMLDCGEGEFPIDYKFYVFHGRTRMIEVAADWKSRLKRNLYNEDGCLLDVVWHNRRERFPELGLPAGFGEMQKVAETLGAEFDFASVDLYMAKGACVFGEISLFPEGGLGRFAPRSFDAQLGSYWRLDTGTGGGRGRGRDRGRGKDRGRGRG